MNEVINLTDPLAALHDIHLPPPIGWWPPAPGWWLLLVLVMVLIVSLFWRLHRRRMQQHRPSPITVKQIVAAASLEMDRLAEDIEAGLVPRQAVADGSRLLRRVAIQLAVLRGDTNDVAGMTGEAWLRWLDAQWNRDDFSQGVGRELIDAPYRHELNINPSALLSLSRTWLEKQS